LPSKNYIIVVEPDDLIRELLQRWLVEAGYRVAVAGSRDKPASASPRLVIADISGPERAVKAIKALRSAYAAPIVALSARFRRGLGGSVDAAQQLGVRNVLPKPFTREELLSAVEQAIGAPDAT